MKLLGQQQVHDLLLSDEIDGESKLSVLKSLCFMVNKSQGDYDAGLQELVLRVLDRKGEFSDFQDVLNSVIRSVGLYPYMDFAEISVSDALAYEMHRPSNFYDDAETSDEGTHRGYAFHRVQTEVFSRLLDGESIILSAPTSFGKSSIVDALIESGKYRNIVIVVPTIALIDETRRRLSRYRNTHKIITHSSQKVEDRNIFVFTQERVVDCQYFPEIDLFVIDEFYKLNPEADKERSATLNHAFYRLSKRSKQFYLLGPNINSIPEGFPERFKCRFFRTDFTTVVTELVRVNSAPGQELERLTDLCKQIGGSTLIFCGSPSKARKIARAMLDAGIENGLKSMDEAADWIGDNYDPDWLLVPALRAGIGMHHGRMPRALAQLVVKAFNEGRLSYLICTSTLIEGVNTKAKNVIIYDNKIAAKKYDYFTFNNIRGRSGRMFEHFIGKVFVFHEEPQEGLPFVDIPIFTQDARNTPESLLIQMDAADLEDNSRQRLAPFENQEILSMRTLRSNIGVSPHRQIDLASDMTRRPALVTALAWSGYPTYDDLKALCVVIWDYFLQGAGMVGGVTSGSQLAFKINLLRSNNLKQLINQERGNVDSADEAVENVLDFIRQWPQYRFGRLAFAVNSIQMEIAGKLGLQAGDYSFFSGQVENLFSDPVLSALDEYGVPFPLAKKLEHVFATDGDLDKAIFRLKNIDLDAANVTLFEKSLLRDARDYI